MSLRFVPTPLEAPITLPQPRSGGIAPALTEAFVPSAAREAALARLKEPGVVAVTTGQQPGLFTGPLYTVYKALSTAALARVLQRHWDRAVVPIFWAAGDDHDFAEASQTAWLDGDGAVATASLAPRAPDAPLTPMYREPLGPAIEQALDRLAADLPPSEYRDQTLDWLRRHYQPSATIGAAFAGAMAELIAPAGIVCFDSTHPAAKRAAAPLLERALEHATEIDSELDRWAEQLGGSARTSGVSVGDGAALVMLESKLGRDRLVSDGGSFVTRRSRERFDLQALRAIAREQPTRLSPNVLLRPVVESALLPTVAYLGGPAELGYLSLTPPVYQRLNIPRQLPLPRWSGIVLEARVERVLQKFQITLEDLLAPAGALEARLVRSQLSPETLEALASIRQAISRGYEIVGRSATEIDPTLTRSVQGVQQQALAGTQDVEKKLVQHLKRRQETELGQIARARQAVLPTNKPQERVLTVAPFLARYGPDLIPNLTDEIERWYAATLEGASQPA
ncbi:MAG TPA: bacillithiol biosynthesis cysteine-adding enzyme BshC [Gemmatimonadales bacterium]